MHNLNFKKTKTSQMLNKVKDSLTKDQKFLRETYFYVLIPKLISSENELHKNLNIMNDLLKIRNNVDTKAKKDIDDYLKTLGHYIEEFETKNYPFDPVKPNDFLLYLLENRNIKRKELIGPVFNSESALSRACNGLRKITVDQAKKLGEFFKIDFKVFL